MLALSKKAWVWPSIGLLSTFLRSFWWLCSCFFQPEDKMERIGGCKVICCHMFLVPSLWLLLSTQCRAWIPMRQLRAGAVAFVKGCLCREARVWSQYPPMDGMESYRGYGAICGYHVPARDPLSTGVQDDRVNTAQYLGVPKTRWFTIHRKFSLELLSFAQMSRGSFVIMFMSHHVGHIIISTTPHQVVGKSDSSEACAFTGEKHSRARNLCFFRVKRLLGSPQ